MQGGYGLSTLRKKRNLFLDNGVNFIKYFYFNMCKLLSATTFVYMFEKFVPNVDYSIETFKIVKKSYLDYFFKKFDKKRCI